MRSGIVGRRATWRWCLAGGGALFILLGIALGIPNSAAGTGDAHRKAAAGTASDQPSDAERHDPTGTTTSAPAEPGMSNGSVSNGSASNGYVGSSSAADLGAPLPVGSSDGTSLASVRQNATTLPSVQTLGVGAPPAQAVPITSTAALLILVIGFGAFGAGWTIGRRRAIPRV
jgi:hypothetical protein